MTHQTYFKNMKDRVQTEMLAEFSGKDGGKQLLIDLEKEKLKLKNKSLPGQINMLKGEEDVLPKN